MNKRFVFIGFEEGEKGVFKDTFKLEGFEFGKVRVVFDFIWNRYIFTFLSRDDKASFYHFKPTRCYNIQEKRYELDFDELKESSKNIRVKGE